MTMTMMDKINSAETAQKNDTESKISVLKKGILEKAKEVRAFFKKAAELAELFEKLRYNKYAGNIFSECNNGVGGGGFNFFFNHANVRETSTPQICLRCNNGIRADSRTADYTAHVGFMPLYEKHKNLIFVGNYNSSIPSATWHSVEVDYALRETRNVLRLSLDEELKWLLSLDKAMDCFIADFPRFYEKCMESANAYINSITPKGDAQAPTEPPVVVSVELNETDMENALPKAYMTMFKGMNAIEKRAFMRGIAESMKTDLTRIVHQALAKK